LAGKRRKGESGNKKNLRIKRANVKLSGTHGKPRGQETENQEEQKKKPTYINGYGGDR